MSSYSIPSAKLQVLNMTHGSVLRPNECVPPGRGPHVVTGYIVILQHSLHKSLRSLWGPTARRTYYPVCVCLWSSFIVVEQCSSVVV